MENKSKWLIMENGVSGLEKRMRHLKTKREGYKLQFNVSGTGKEDLCTNIKESMIITKNVLVLHK